MFKAGGNFTFCFFTPTPLLSQVLGKQSSLGPEAPITCHLCPRVASASQLAAPEITMSPEQFLGVKSFHHLQPLGPAAEAEARNQRYITRHYVSQLLLHAQHNTVSARARRSRCLLDVKSLTERWPAPQPALGHNPAVTGGASTPFIIITIIYL